MITLFHVSGALIYFDDAMRPCGHDDVHTKIELCRKHYERVGLGADYVRQFIRYSDQPTESEPVRRFKDDRVGDDNGSEADHIKEESRMLR